MRAVSILVLIACLVLGVFAQYQHLEQESFANIKNLHGQQFVVFYFSSQPDQVAKLDEIEKAAAVITSEIPNFSFKICDGELPVNNKDFAEATFTSANFYMFTQINEQGIQRYTHEAESDVLIKHIRSFYASFNPDDVSSFTTETEFFELLDSADTPVVVKFFENWCTHCKALKKPFHVAATMFKEKARFLDVECSHNVETKAFCAKHQANSFPVLMVFDSERKHKFDFDSRSVINLERFIDDFRAGKTGSSSSAPTPAAVNNAAPKPAAPRSNLGQTPSSPSLGNQGALEARVANLERVIEALTIRLEAAERK